MMPAARLLGTICTVLLTCAALAGGCAQIPRQVLGQIEIARVQFNENNHAACEQTLNPVIRDYASNPGIAAALYIRGQCRLLTDRRNEALGDFERAAHTARDTSLKAISQAQLGNMAYDDGYYDQACLNYARAADRLPHDSPTDRIRYQYGVSLQRTGRFVEARRVFTALRADFPQSQWSIAAGRKLDWDHEYYSVQCGAFGRIELAHEAAARLRDDGFSALAYPDDRSGGLRYVVRVGRFDRYEHASRVLGKLRPTHPDAFIVP